MDSHALYRGFRSVVAAQPDRAAAIGQAGGRTSFRELAGLVDDLTREIEAVREKEHDCLIVALPRSPGHLAAVLAAWRAGLAYVPMRAHEPPARRKALLSQLAGRALLVADGGVRPVGGCSRGERLSWSPGSVGYVVFTSGSTGTPKGVVLPVTALANRVDWSQRAYPLRPDDVVLQHTAPTFDFAIWEMAASLLHGSTLLLTEDEARTDLEEVVELAVARHATVAHFVPSALSLVCATKMLTPWKSLRLLYSGGEQLTGALARRVLADIGGETGALLVNQYGPAETCVDSTHHAVTSTPATEVVPIGKPIDATECRVIDGELYIGGAGVALGYLDPAEPAAGRFTTVPGSSSRWFRTGDVATVDDAGDLVFLGRADDQVKISGVRVDLAEIEAVAARLTGGRVAVAITEPSGDGLVVDLLVETQDAPPMGLRAALAEYFSGPALPRRVHVVPALPRLDSGKVDRARIRMTRKGTGKR